MGCDNLLSQLTHVVVFLMRMGCLVAHRHDCMKLKATDQAAVFLTRWEWECVNMWTLWHHRLCCLNSIIIIPLWLMSCCSVLHAVSPGCTLLLRIAHESHVSCVMCVSTKDKKTAWALWCFFFMVETILLIWSASGMAELVILPPAGEWPRAVDGEESCPSWMSLIGGEQWLSPQAVFHPHQ